MLSIGLAALGLLFAAEAKAALPGENGKIAFSRGTARMFMNPDGSAQAPATAGGREWGWSPDGLKLAGSCGGWLCSQNTDGTGFREVAAGDSVQSANWSPDGSQIVYSEIVCLDPCQTHVNRVDANANPDDGPFPLGVGLGYGPVWSPDGSKIAFDSSHETGFTHSELYIAPASGGGQTRLTNNGSIHDQLPDFSPDGRKIVFTTNRDGNFEIYTIDPDGTDPTRITVHAATDTSPIWSPDGKKIAFATNRDDPNPSTCNPCNYEIYTMDPDGTNPTRLTNDPAADMHIEWQPIIRGYPRPQGARYLRVPLAIAYEPCAEPGNRTHGPALSFPSCAPPAQSSEHLTVGTTDANGEAPKFNGAVRYFVQPGTPGGADDADVDLDLLATDIRNLGSLSDYSGELEARVTIRITDRQNQPSPPSGGHGTVTDLPLSFVAPCATTSDTSVGSTCQVSTTADTVVPGAAVEGKRSIWELEQIEVYDGGADGVAATGPNTLFATQGVFVP